MGAEFIVPAILRSVSLYVPTVLQCFTIWLANCPVAKKKKTSLSTISETGWTGQITQKINFVTHNKVKEVT